MAILKPSPKPGGEASVLDGFAAGGSFGPASADKVFMGTRYSPSPHGGSGQVAPDRPTDLWVSKDEALQDFYKWDAKDRRRSARRASQEAC